MATVSRRILLTGLLITTAFALAQNSTQSPSTAASRMAAPQASASDRQNFPPLLMQQLFAIKATGLSDDYAYHQLEHLTENIGPRQTGSPQATAAAEYVAGELRKLGMEVQLQPVSVLHWVRGVESAALVEYSGMVPNTTQKIVLTALGGSTSTPADGLTADVVTVNSFDELSALGREKVAGKIVFFNELFDKQKAAAGLGAVAALVRSVGNADYRLPHTGFSIPAGIPAAAVTAEDADLIAHLALQGKVRMHLTLTSQQLPNETSYNVIADLKGSEHPEQVVVVSGHLDSWDLGW
jgi:carboxypeptidase Q